MIRVKFKIQVFKKKLNSLTAPVMIKHSYILTQYLQRVLQSQWLQWMTS
jgi:hypothetical protein